MTSWDSERGGSTFAEWDWENTLEEFEGAVDRWTHPIAYNSYMEKYER